jgi:hydroxyacylglutathione hydrolase
MNQDQPIRPANIANIVAINQGKNPLTMDSPQCPALNHSEVNEMMSQDHLIVDTRSSAAFGSGHIPGAYNIQLVSPEFEQRVGWVTPLERPMILVLDDDANGPRAMHNLAFVGLDQRISGCLSGGMKTWINNGLLLKTVTQLSVRQLEEHLRNGLGMKALDVRETSEWDAGHIESAHYMNYKILRESIGELMVTPDDHISVVCAEGLRSSTACSILLQNGYKNIYNITGGMTAWAAAGLPMIDVDGCPVTR